MVLFQTIQTNAFHSFCQVQVNRAYSFLKVYVIMVMINCMTVYALSCFIIVTYPSVIIAWLHTH